MSLDTLHEKDEYYQRKLHMMNAKRLCRPNWRTDSESLGVLRPVNHCGYIRANVQTENIKRLSQPQISSGHASLFLQAAAFILFYFLYAGNCCEQCP